MKWDEFCDLLSGISPDSPLGRMVQIRLENDKDVLKHFTPTQRKIRSEWRSRQAKAISADDAAAAIEQIKQAFISMT